MKKVTNQELLERITKLENLTQELEKKIKKILNSCSCVKLDLEERNFRENENYFQLLENSTYGVDFQYIYNHYYCSKKESQKLLLF